MPERYAVSDGNWVAARFDGGTLPAPGDTVHAGGYTVVVDVNVTVAALSTRAGSVAVAGGSFTASGAVTITADTYAGTTSCLTLPADSGAVQIGRSYGSDTTNSRYGTTLHVTTTQYGNCYGGGANTATGTLGRRGRVVGNAYGGTGTGSFGFSASAEGGILIGTAYGGAGSAGADIGYGSNHYGDSYGSATAAFSGVNLAGGHQTGSAYGGGFAGAHGTKASRGSIFFGKATGSSTADANGVYVTDGGNAIVTLATGNALNREGVRNDTSVPGSVVVVDATSGTHPTFLDGLLDDSFAFYTSRNPLTQRNPPCVLYRTLEDARALTFSWPNSIDSVQCEVAINNGTYVPAVGAVAYLRAENGRYYYTLAYNAADRPSAEGTARYRFYSDNYSFVATMHVVKASPTLAAIRDGLAVEGTSQDILAGVIALNTNDRREFF